MPRAASLLLLLLGWASLGLPAAAGEGGRADAEVAFAYGVDAYNRGDDATAVQLLTEALELDPRHRLARHYLALARARLGGEPAPGEVFLPTALGELAPLGDVPLLALRVGAAQGRDSNPLLVPEGTAAELPDGDRLTGPEADQVTDLDLRLDLHPVVGRRGLTLGIALAARQSLFSDFGFLDFGSGRAVVSLAWGEDSLGLLTGPLGYARVPRGGGAVVALAQAGFAQEQRDGETFRRGSEASLALRVHEAAWTATQLELAWTDDDYTGGANDPRSGRRVAGSLSQWLYLGRRDRSLRLSAWREERDAGAAFDATTTEGRAELSLPFGARWTLFLVGAAGRQDFDDLASNPYFPLFIADQAREDSYSRAAASLAWAFRPSWVLSLRGSWFSRETEIGQADTLANLDVERTTFALGVSWFSRFEGGGR
ncbi:MAG TPA: hypothetical protein VF017_13540 [Thermoanaerobaculia bacterium]|nr:hypothetical protein [Thermoanaerobaculia bacterium]